MSSSHVAFPLPIPIMLGFHKCFAFGSTQHELLLIVVPFCLVYFLVIHKTVRFLGTKRAFGISFVPFIALRLQMEGVEGCGTKDDFSESLPFGADSQTLLLLLRLGAWLRDLDK